MTSLPFMTEEPVRRPLRHEITPDHETYSAILFLRRRGYEVEPVSERQHRMRAGDDEWRFLMTRDLKRTARLAGWRSQ